MPTILPAEKNPKLYGLFIIAAIMLLLIFFSIYWKGGITGQAIVSLTAGQHYVYQIISGTVDLTIEDGEFLPAETIAKGEFAGKEKNFTLEQIIISSGTIIEKTQGNFSVENTNISGFGDGYGIEGGGTISFNLSAFDLKAEEEGKYDLVISLSYNGSAILEEQKKIKIKTCVSNWKQHNTSCMADDTKTGYYKDTKECYEKTGQESYLLERPENITYACDYCLPNWKPKNTSCMADDTKIRYYNDSNNCFNKTGLDSDLVGRPENITYACDYCLPNWKPKNTSCLIGDMIVEWYNDTKGCFFKTGLDSDLLGRGENKTYEFSCSYYGNNLIGTVSAINTEIKNLNIIIANSEDLTQPFTDLQKVLIKEQNAELIEFNFNFSLDILNLANLTIEKQAENATRGSFAVKGIDVSAQNETKTVYVDTIANSAGVCIKDEENVNAEEISISCNATNEFLVKCPGSAEGYACEFSSNLRKYKISGLKHSAVVELPAFCGDGSCNDEETCSSCSADCGSCPASTTSAGGGGGGTPGGSCIPEWECSEWNACVNGIRTRTCTNLKAYCPVNKPAEEQDCEMAAPSVPNATEEKETVKNETQLPAETPQTRPGILGGFIGVITAMPLGFKISIAGTFISLILVLIASIIFIMLVRRKETLEESIGGERVVEESEEKKENIKERDIDNERPEEIVG